MDLKEIKKILELMDDHGLSQFKLEEDDTKLELKKGGFDTIVQAAPQALAPAPAAPAPAAVAPADSGGGDADALPAGVVEITSPMVGTFYRAQNPDSDPFVEIGSKVEDSTQVCIVEAMKVMNAITAEVRGEITEVLVENGTPVQFGEPLFRVKTS